jgi:ABC-type Fe3+/spermidine/putrescine transport system ATPase subunit
MSSSSAPILELRSVTKAFDGYPAVRGVTEAFGTGEYVCILGASGCGKTTLLRMIAGFEDPDGGDILLAGRSLLPVPAERRNVNLVFQDYALFPHMSVLENVAFGLRVKRVERREATRRATEALTLVGLEQAARRLPRELSGGQRQRVALARALVNRPAVLLLDEPLSALDRALRLQMQAELRAIQREVGITFLHVTHDQSEALRLADRVAVMHAGRFVQVGPAREVYDRPRSRLVAEFVGASNIVARAQLAAWLGDSAGGPGLALVRPERIGLLPAPGADGSLIPGTVASVAYLGATVECAVDVAGGRLTVHAPAAALGAALEPQTPVWLRIVRADVVPLADDAP